MNARMMRHPITREWLVELTLTDEDMRRLDSGRVADFTYETAEGSAVRFVVAHAGYTADDPALD